MVSIFTFISFNHSHVNRLYYWKISNKYLHIEFLIVEIAINLYTVLVSKFSSYQVMQNSNLLIFTIAINFLSPTKCKHFMITILLVLILNNRAYSSKIFQYAYLYPSLVLFNFSVSQRNSLIMASSKTKYICILSISLMVTLLVGVIILICILCHCDILACRLY